MYSQGVQIKIKIDWRSEKVVFCLTINIYLCLKTLNKTFKITSFDHFDLQQWQSLSLSLDLHP